MPDTGTLAAYSIVSWVRRGMASLVTGQATTNYASLAVSVGINGTEVAAPPVRLQAPGDITGLDPRAVIRTDPRDGADAFEPNYLAMVELALPDLPWTFTPSGDLNGYLQPWICLVVLPDAPGAEIETATGGLSLLRITAPLDPKLELPDLKTIGYWAHAQVTGGAGTDLHTAFTSDTAGTLSRLVSSRKLEPGKAYIACIVPTYHAGVNAALGLPVDENDVAPAWDLSSMSAPFVLPVYYTFRFQTGPGGDFESLARAITPGSAAAAGTRPMLVGDPQFGITSIAGKSAPLKLDLEGALKAVDLSGKAESPIALWPDDVLQSSCAEKLTAALKAGYENPPVVTPPSYGSAQSGFQLFAPPAQMPKPPGPPEWLGELNLDPRTRVAASAGAQVVQKNQDALVASTWEQAGEIRKMNALLQRGQFAREISTSLLKRHIGTVGSDGVLLQMTAPLHRRISVEAHLTLRSSIAASLLPCGAVSGTMRKITRMLGPVGRQFKKNAPSIVERLNRLPGAGTDALQVTRPLTAPAGMIAFGDVDPTFPSIQKEAMLTALHAPPSGWRVAASIEAPRPVVAVDEREVRLRPGNLDVAAYRGPRQDIPIHPVLTQGPVTATTLLASWSSNVPLILTAKRKDLPAPLAFPTADADLGLFNDQFQSAAAQVVNYLGGPPAAATPQQPLASFKVPLMSRLNPEITIQSRLKFRIPIGDGPDSLQPVRTGPEFPSSPMYEPLAELSPEWMLPGISSISIDKAVLVEPNARFIESYMLGLNEELSRELLWRQFPAALNSTFFRNFWTSSLAGGSTSTDIPEIRNFNPDKHLGDHVNSLASAKTVVLLIRANLFRRYPNAIVSLVQANWVAGANPPVRALAGPFNLPQFRGEIGLDVTFFGFALDGLQLASGQPKPANPADLQGSADPAHNNAGWYFVIEEHLAEPRFGLEPLELLDKPLDAGSSQLAWADLSWADLPLAKPLGATFLDPKVLPAKYPKLESVTWGTDAASMAYILMREPVRVAMHAIALLEFPAAQAAKS